MITYQLDEDFLFSFTNEKYDTKAFRSVDVKPPAIRDGFVAKWETDLCPVNDINFGEKGTGKWTLLEDNRGVDLYNTSDGSKYEGDYKGIGAIPDHLTTEPKPSDHHVWKNGGWWIDPEAEEELAYDALKKQADSKIISLLQAASEAIAPLQDAVDLGMATDEEAGMLVEWKKYRVLLNRVAAQPGFPREVEWPIEPQLPQQ